MAHLTEVLAPRRAAAQGLAGARDRTPAALVERFGAVQAQDYPYALWSVAQRLAHDVAAVEAALAGGAILRTHILRPTWHFVPRDDLRWMQALTSSRVLAQMAPIDRRHGVDAALIARSTRAIAAAIAKRGHLTRREIAAVLSRAGGRPDAWIVSALLIHAELRAVVCSGVPRERQQTYALVEERAPRAIGLGRDDALATLAARYFQSHGPATVKDFRWWSGLDAASAARGVAALGRRFDRIPTAIASTSRRPPRRGRVRWRRISSSRSTRSSSPTVNRAMSSIRPALPARAPVRCCCAACSSTAGWPAAGPQSPPARARSASSRFAR